MRSKLNKMKLHICDILDCDRLKKDKIGIRIIHSLTFGLLFIIASNSITDFYYKNFDNREYFYIHEEVIPLQEQVVKPCEYVHYSFTRTSLIDTDLTVSAKIYLIKVGDEAVVIEPSTQRVDTFAKKGTEHVSYRWQVPCNLSREGSYYLRWDHRYLYKNNIKHYIIDSTVFALDIK